MYAQVAVNVPHVKGLYDYHLPAGLGEVAPGCLVVVPFGAQTVQGVVLRLVEDAAVPETRPVLALLDPQPVLTPAQLGLAGWLAEETLSPLAACLDLMLPPGLGQQADVQLELRFQAQEQPALFQDPQALGKTQQRLVKLLLERGALRGRQVDAALPHLEWRPAARSLERSGLLTMYSILAAPSVRPKMVRTAQLSCSLDEAEVALPGLGRAGSQPLARRQSMLRFLMTEPGPVETTWLYAESGGKLDDLRFLAERGLVVIGESEVWRDPLSALDYQPTDPPQLTRQQQAAWEIVKERLETVTAGQPVRPLLLFGVTGSGKTEIYLHAVEHALKLGRQAIILVPEISLTPQTVRRFISRFPGQVGLVHSRLTPGERYDTWRRARAGDLSLVVGPRSALFTPFPNLGLIVVDEFHDESYYQEDPQPRYHAREAAIAYARLAGAICLLGSATPDVAGAYLARQGAWERLDLPERILAHRQVVQAQIESLGLRPASPFSRFRPLEGQAETAELPPVNVVDMRQELQAGNRSIFSRPLQESLARTLEQGQQAILFLNRRGSATYIFCRDCGYILRCPRCDLPLTAHSFSTASIAQEASTQPKPEEGGGVLICHSCNYRRRLPSKCPQCGSQRIRQYGAGTERVETEVQALFPQARTLRWDWETTRSKGAHDVIMSHFIAHRADILIGTQMLAKGLDLPLVTLVGVVLADTGLSLPDYRAGERTFQLLTQVAGRAGRSPLGGQVIMQTFQPEHYAIQAASHHDFTAFYQQELEFRRKLAYPPFTRLVRLEYRHLNPRRAETAAQELGAQVHRWLAGEQRGATLMSGPAPCFFARQNGLYRWQIVLRGPDPASLFQDRPLADWRIEVDPPSLL